LCCTGTPTENRTQLYGKPSGLTLPHIMYNITCCVYSSC